MHVCVHVCVCVCVGVQDQVFEHCGDQPLCKCSAQSSYLPNLEIAKFARGNLKLRKNCKLGTWCGT